MLLLLLRHGVADDKSLPIPDKWRKLTAEGRAALLDFYPKLISHVDDWVDKPDAAIEIWSSPKLRALETAELLAEASSWRLADPVSSLANGDFHSFLEQVRSRPDLDLVIASGHEPFFSRWVGLMTGEAIIIAKGGAVALRFDPRSDQLSAELIWYLEPARVPGEKRKKRQKLKKQKSKRGRDSEMKQRFESAYGDVLEQEERFLADPSNPDAAHKLRVRTRSLRALLSFYRPLLEIRNYREIQDGLRETAHLVERLRELDVLMEEYAAVMAEEPAPLVRDPEGSELLALLQRERVDEAQILLTLIRAGRLNELRQPFLRFLKFLNVADDATFEEKRYKTWRKRILSDCKRLGELRYSGIHRLRIRVKKARYALEAIPGLRAGKREAELAELRRLQSDLGKLCDLYRNREAMWELAALDAAQPANAEISYYIEYLNAQDHHIMVENQSEDVK